MIDVGESTTTFIFIVDTEQYSGNFERQMTAFMTGRLGECNIGRDEARRFYEDRGLVGVGYQWGDYEEQDYEDLGNPFGVITRSDEHGTSRPTTIFPTPGWFNDGMGGHFRGKGEYPAYLSVAIFMCRRPTDEEVGILVDRAGKYADESNITVTGYRILAEVTTLSNIWPA